MFNYVKFKFLNTLKFCLFFSFTCLFVFASNENNIINDINTIHDARLAADKATQLPNDDDINIFERAFIAFSGNTSVKIGISTFLYYVEKNDLDKAANRLIEILNEGEYKEVFTDEKYGMDKFYNLFIEHGKNIFFKKNIIYFLEQVVHDNAEYNRIFHNRVIKRYISPEESKDNTKNKTLENQSNDGWCNIF